LVPLLQERTASAYIPVFKFRIEKCAPPVPALVFVSLKIEMIPLSVKVNSEIPEFVSVIEPPTSSDLISSD
jgi:hypothetical protein